MHSPRSFLHLLLDAVFPRRTDIAQLEAQSARDLANTLPPAPHHPTKYIESVFAYRHPDVKRIVWEIKYQGNPKLAETMAACMHERLLPKLSDDMLVTNTRHLLIVPIPMSRTRRTERGFNQAQILARKLHTTNPRIYTGVCNILSRTRETTPQTDVPHRQARITNMKNVFAIQKPDRVTGHDVLVVDDVTTTGATLRDARRALKAAGARTVQAVTVAH